MSSVIMATVLRGLDLVHSAPQEGCPGRGWICRSQGAGDAGDEAARDGDVDPVRYGHVDGSIAFKPYLEPARAPATVLRDRIAAPRWTPAARCQRRAWAPRLRSRTLSCRGAQPIVWVSDYFDFQMPSCFSLATFSARSTSFSWCSKSRMPEAFQRRANPAETSAALSEVCELSAWT